MPRQPGSLRRDSQTLTIHTEQSHRREGELGRWRFWRPSFLRSPVALSWLETEVSHRRLKRFPNRKLPCRLLPWEGL